MKPRWGDLKQYDFSFLEQNGRVINSPRPLLERLLEQPNRDARGAPGGLEAVAGVTGGGWLVFGILFVRVPLCLVDSSMPRRPIRAQILVDPAGALALLDSTCN